MDARQNGIEILRFGKPEKVVGGLPACNIRYIGCNHECYDGSGGHEVPVGSVWTDIWGTVWKKELPVVMGFPQVHPLAKIESLRSYPWPDPDDERICGQIYKGAKDSAPDGRFLCGSHRETLWEKAYMLVGMEDLMIYLYTEPNFVREIFHRVMDFQLGIAKHYLAAGVEMVGMGDDMGTQAGPLLGPRIVSECLVPEYRRLFAVYKPKGILVSFHSCGNILSMLETFMDLGVDVLNPVQAKANDLDEVRRVTQGRMALQGAVATDTIMNGPVEAIVAEVRQRLWQLGRHGGYFCGPDQFMPFPEAHIQAFHEALERYGTYPLQRPNTDSL